MPPPGRPDLYVVARLLDQLWRSDGPMLKTRLQLAAGVNYDILVRYLLWMQERGLVSLVNDEHGYERVALTVKGREAVKTLVHWINEVVKGRP